MSELGLVRLMVVVLAVAMGAFSFLEIGHLRTEQLLLQQQTINTKALQNDNQILAEVRADEAKYCLAARASGDAAIIKIVCPSASS